MLTDGARCDSESIRNVLGTRLPAAFQNGEHVASGGAQIPAHKLGIIEGNVMHGSRVYPEILRSPSLASSTLLLPAPCSTVTFNKPRLA